MHTNAGTFVPLRDVPLRGKQSARVGWIVAENGCHIWQGAQLVALRAENLMLKWTIVDQLTGPATAEERPSG